jgi:hypothetical protein
MNRALDVLVLYQQNKNLRMREKRERSTEDTPTCTEHPAAMDRSRVEEFLTRVHATTGGFAAPGFRV